nr:hypothetical protein [uncultured Rhodopila sp.]
MTPESRLSTPPRNAAADGIALAGPIGRGGWHEWRNRCRRVDIDFTRLRICVLTFLIYEALRFRSIHIAARSWMLPSSGHWPVFEITGPMLDLAQSWKEKAAANIPASRHGWQHA